MHENGIKISALSFAIACALAFVAEAARAQGPASSNDPFAAFSDSLTVVPAASTLNNRGQFYVPVFSSIRMGGGRTRLDLAVTLSIHNASETEVLVLERVDYFNSAGTLVQSYLARPIAVRPYGTVEVFIAADDVHTLFIGWYDYMLAVGALPIEAQVFQIWYFALYPEKLNPKSIQRYISGSFQCFRASLGPTRSGRCARSSSRSDEMPTS
jgi:hypothetical protein